MTETNLSTGAKIRALRGLYFLSQAKLAEAIGVHQGTLSRIENGQLALSAEIKTAIENHFNISLDDSSSNLIGLRCGEPLAA